MSHPRTRRPRRLAPVLLTLCCAGVALAVPVVAPPDTNAASKPATPRPAALATQPTEPPAFEAAEKAMDAFKVASGLTVKVFAAEPQLANAVALNIDDKGRFWVVETFRFDAGGKGEGVYDIRHRYHQLDEDLACKTVEQRLEVLNKWNNGDLSKVTAWPDRVRLIEDRNGDGRADFSSVFRDDFAGPLEGVAAGVLSVGDDVYFANVPHLWKLRDTDGDGRADVKESLSYGYGVRFSLLGHDLHGLRMGPDGKIYFSMGDRGLHVKTKEGNVIDVPDEGSVLRCDPDGANLELYARGLRNPQKLVFDDYGNLFTGDNNCDHGDPARWVYVMEGGDTGWRIGYQHLKTPRPTGPWLEEKLFEPEGKNTAAYLLPPIAHVGFGPSGCTFYPGTGLPERFDRHFFLTDFRAGPSSFVHSFALKPKGASFEVVDRGRFIAGLVPTDIEFGIDSAAYVTDWMGGYQPPMKGRIFRVFDEELDKSPEVLETKKIMVAGMTQRKTDELVGLLGHKNQRVRNAAQFEIAKRGAEAVPLLEKAARAHEKQLGRIHALWALGQIARAKPEALNVATELLSDSDPELRAQAAKITGEHRVAAVAPQLIKLLQDPSARVQSLAAIALGRVHSKDAIEPLLKMLADAADKDAYLRHAGVMGLAGAGDVEALLAHAADESPSVRMGVVLALRKMEKPEVAAFLEDKDAKVAAEAARAINDVPIAEAFPQLAKLAANPALPEVVLHRALNANLRLGAAENASAVAAVAASEKASEVMRVEAIRMLADWTKPRGADRVVGVWRPLTPRDPAIAATASRSILRNVLTTGPEQVRLAAIDLVKAVGTDDASLLFDVVTDKGTMPGVAAAALATMDEKSDPRLNEAVDHALANGKGALRARAIGMLARRSDAVDRLQALLSGGSIADQQAVIAALGHVEAPAAEKILATWADNLVAGKVAPEVQLEVVEAINASKFDALKEKLKQYDASKPKDDPVAAYREAIAGGDPELGKKIFFERTDVSCVRCHKVNGTGGMAGPDLSDVAVRKDRNYLLESLVDPNKQIAPGFEAVTVKVKAGKSYTGVVKADTDAEVVLDAGDGAVVHIDKKEVDSRTKGMSPMPQEVVKPLNKREVRDLVEYLATLKQKPAAQGQ